MKKILSILTGLLFGIVGVGIGHASTITLDDNLTDGTYITAGISLHGVFNMTPYLSPHGQFNAPEIQSASYTFTFEDDLDRVFTHNTTTQYVRYSNWWAGTYKHRNTINHYEDEYEKVTAEVLGQLNYADTAEYDKTNFVTQSFDGTSNWGTIRCYTDHYDNVNGYTGSMSITYSLAADQLQSLSGDGMLTFELSSVSGDMIYTGGSLTVAFNESPVQGTAHTPEPATMALFGFGLLAFAKISRRKQ